MNSRDPYQDRLRTATEANTCPGRKTDFRFFKQETRCTIRDGDSRGHRRPNRHFGISMKKILDGHMRIQSKYAVIGMSCALIFLWSPTDGHAASFDCSKASSPTEKMICSDGTLSQLDGVLGDAYRKAKDRAASKAELKQKQNRWLPTRNACHDRKCIQRAYELRIKELNEFALSQNRDASHGKNVIQEVPMTGTKPSKTQTKKTTSQPDAPSVCVTMLNPNVIRWIGAGEVGDRFTVDFPDDTKPVSWKFIHNSGGAVTIYEAIMAFTGKGKKETIFRIEVYTSHTQSTSYLLASEDKVDYFRNKLSSVQGAQWDTQLPTVLETLGRSKLYDSSSTKVYQWYTSSELFTFQGRTYMVALSVNNLKGPTAAIFQPKADGNLQLVCRYDVKPSKRTWTKTFQSSTKSCPTDESHYPKIPNAIELTWEPLSETI